MPKGWSENNSPAGKWRDRNVSVKCYNRRVERGVKEVGVGEGAWGEVTRGHKRSQMECSEG